MNHWQHIDSHQIGQFLANNKVEAVYGSCSTLEVRVSQRHSCEPVERRLARVDLLYASRLALYTLQDGNRIKREENRLASASD